MSVNSINLEKLEVLSVMDENSVPVTIKHFWQEKTAVLVFIRHFG